MRIFQIYCDLEINETYIASFFIKIENINEGEEKYYSLIYEIKKENAENQENPENERNSENQNNKEHANNNSTRIIILIIIIVLIIAFILFFIFRKIRIKSSSLEDKINDTNFSSGLNEDLKNNQELEERTRSSGSYLNTFL